MLFFHERNEVTADCILQEDFLREVKLFANVINRFDGRIFNGDLNCSHMIFRAFAFSRLNSAELTA